MHRRWLYSAGHRSELQLLHARGCVSTAGFLIVELESLTRALGLLESATEGWGLELNLKGWRVGFRVGLSPWAKRPRKPGL